MEQQNHGANAETAASLPLDNHRRGKVREVYDAQTRDGRPITLLVASDRLSAFDVVMPTPVPGKGRVLTELSAFWFSLIECELGGGLSHHLLSTDAEQIAGLTGSQREAICGRVMLGRRCRVVPIECVARGYLAGSGWKEYRATGEVCGVPLPAGLREGDRLPEPIFTPATKAAEGHDQNISFDQACRAVGGPLMETLRRHTLAVYRLGHDHAEARGIILADTKLEFGRPLDPSADGGPAGSGGRSELPPEADPILIDEVLTPDSSRFWPADTYAPGGPQPSFDKQFVRDYLQGLVDAGRWDKTPPGPELPEAVVGQTYDKYAEAQRRLTGAAG